MTSLALALLLAQLAQPAPGGLAYPLGADLAAPGAVYQLGPNAPPPSLSWTPAAPAVPNADASAAYLWHLDEASGSAVDAVGGLTLAETGGSGTVGVLTGIYSGARGGPAGAGSRLQAAAPAGMLTLLQAGNYTLDFWVNFSADNPGGSTVENLYSVYGGSPAANLGIVYWYKADHILHYYWSTGSGTVSDTTTSIVIGTGWQHIAITITATGATRTLKAYKNGVLTDTVTGLTAPAYGFASGTIYLSLGNDSTGLSPSYAGLDDVRLTSRVLTAAEVLALYRRSGRWSSPPAPVIGPSLAFTRASTGTYESAAGHVVNALSGELRCGYLGCLIEPSRTNQVLRSAEFSHAAWTSAGITVTADSVAAPDGTTSADTLTVSAGPGSLYQITSASSGAYTGSVWVRSGTSSTVGLDVGCVGGTATTCTCRTSRGDSCSVNNISANCIATASLGSSGWTRFEVTATCPALTSSVAMSLGPDAFVGSVGKTAYFWGAQLEQGAHASSVLLTTTTAVTRAADVLSVADSVLGAGAASVHLALTPEWASSVDSTLLASTTPNELGLATVSGTLDWLVGGNDISTASLGWSAGTAQAADAWYSPGGAWRVTDGTHSASGVSAATPSTGGTLYLGGSSSAGAGVAISQIKVCKRAGVCR